jgi:hypothetical protein
MMGMNDGGQSGQSPNSHKTHPPWHNITDPCPESPAWWRPVVPHHVTQRGNHRQDIFLLDEDCRFYLAALADNRQRHGLRVLGEKRAEALLTPLVSML